MWCDNVRGFHKQWILLSGVRIIPPDTWHQAWAPTRRLRALWLWSVTGCYSGFGHWQKPWHDLLHSQVEELLHWNCPRPRHWTCRAQVKHSAFFTTPLIMSTHLFSCEVNRNGSVLYADSADVKVCQSHSLSLRCSDDCVVSGNCWGSLKENRLISISGLWFQT